MGLLSKFKTAPDAASAAASLDAHDVVHEARSRARRRLIGAAVLLGVGIIGFPLLFETQPRPIPVDIPIEIPSRESAAPLLSPASRPGAARAQAETVITEPAEPSDSRDTVAKVKPVTEPAPTASAEGSARTADKPAEAPRAASKPVPPARPASIPVAAKPTPKPEDKPAAKPADKPVAKPADKPAEKPTEKASDKPADKAASKPAEPSAADSGRWVVQIGAFSEVNSAREARLKVEAMGLKTYTQVIESPTGRRIRVRIGPYASKAEAEKAAARIKAGGLPTALLLL